MKTPNRLQLSWFTRFFFKYKTGLLVALGGAAAIQTLLLIPPFIMMSIIDRVMLSSNSSSLYVLIIGMVAVGLATNLLGYVNAVLQMHTATRIGSEIFGAFQKHLYRLPLAFYLQRQVGEITARWRESDGVIGFISEWTAGQTVELVFTAVYLVILFSMSPLLTLILLFSIPFSLVEYVIFGSPLRKRMIDSFNAGAHNEAILIETLSNIEVIKSNCKEETVQRRMSDLYAGFQLANFRANWLRLVSGQFAGVVGSLTDATILLFGVKAVLDGAMTLGELTAFNMISGRVSGPILRLSKLWERFIQLRFSLDRVGDILLHPPEDAQQGREHTVVGAVSFRQTTFMYQPGRPILQNLNFDILPGEILCIVGESGSGKSTLTKLISRLIEPQYGYIAIDNQDVRQLSMQSIRPQIAYVIQDNAIFAGTVRDNIKFSNEVISEEEMVHAAELACAHEFILSLPQGYDTSIAERGANLSGGQRQRIALARALASNARILVLDEATSALDYDTEHRIVSNIRSICRDRTVVIVSHRLSVAKQADNILVLKEGQIIEQGAHSELISGKGHYQRLCELSNLVI